MLNGISRANFERAIECQRNRAAGFEGLRLGLTSLDAAIFPKVIVGIAIASSCGIARADICFAHALITRGAGTPVNPQPSNDDDGGALCIANATTNGISVPRSPNAPAHSMRSKRLRVATLRAGS